MTEIKTCERGAIDIPRTDLEKVERLWGPPPWELHLGGFYAPEVMERVTAITMDGARFERVEECRWVWMEEWNDVAAIHECLYAGWGLDCGCFDGNPIEQYDDPDNPPGNEWTRCPHCGAHVKGAEPCQ